MYMSQGNTGFIGSSSRLGCLTVSMEFAMVQQPMFVTVHLTGGNSARLTDYLKPFTVNKDPNLGPFGPGNPLCATIGFISSICAVSGC